MAASVMVGGGRHRPHRRSAWWSTPAPIVPGKNLGPVISRRGQGADRALHHRGGAGGCEGAAGWTEHRGAGPRGRLLRRPDGPRPRPARHGDRPGRGLRPGARDRARARTWTRRCAIENASPYGNAASVFTESGGLARYVTERASAGMVGVNVGVPVPREPFSFGGWNDSQVRRRRHHRARVDRVLDPDRRRRRPSGIARRAPTGCRVGVWCIANTAHSHAQTTQHQTTYLEPICPN